MAITNTHSLKITHILRALKKAPVTKIFTRASSPRGVVVSLIEVGTSETGTTVLLIPVNEQTFLVIADDDGEQDTPYPTLV